MTLATARVVENDRALDYAIRGSLSGIGVAAPRPAMNLSEGVWRFDPVRWTLTTPSGYAVKLTMCEYIVMDQLLGRAGQVASRDQLRAALEQRHVRLYNRNLDSLISRLRAKTERAGRDEKLPIMAARNVGYVFTGRCEAMGEAVPAQIIATQRAAGVQAFPGGLSIDAWSSGAMRAIDVRAA